VKWESVVLHSLTYRLIGGPARKAQVRLRFWGPQWCGVLSKKDGKRLMRWSVRQNFKRFFGGGDIDQWA